MANVVDLFLVYQFIKRLAMPFVDWDAYKRGIIDDKGKVLKKRSTLTSIEDRKAWGYYDIMLANLKKLLGKIPGGQTKVASYIAAGLLLKEDHKISQMSEEEIEIFVKKMFDENIANVVSSGAIAGTGENPPGPYARLGKMMRRKKRRDEIDDSRRNY